jgi:hypothetical protein
MKEAAMSDLLSRRMRVLRLDRHEIARLEPVTYGELQWRCVLCQDRDRCEAGLADDFADVAWRAYCPNAAMLNAIGELPWFRMAAV